MKIIPIKLPNKKASVPCRVDDEDHEMLSGFKWRLDKYGYARTTTRAFSERDRKRGSQSYALIHSSVRWTPKGMQIDHINGDKLDNRRKNLRVCTPQQNCFNRTSYGKSRYKGVSWHQSASKWQVYIQKDGVAKYVGVFKDEKEAARAYDNEAKRLFGDYAKLNFHVL